MYAYVLDQMGRPQKSLKPGSVHTVHMPIRVSPEAGSDMVPNVLVKVYLLNETTKRKSSITSRLVTLTKEWQDFPFKVKIPKKESVSHIYCDVNGTVEAEDRVIVTLGELLCGNEGRGNTCQEKGGA